MRWFLRTAGSIIQAHQSLPRLVRLQYLVPFTILVVSVLGFGLTLPPGPLCDEGMVLFMEGGCDFGESNVFFYSKTGLMLSLVIAFALAWRSRIRNAGGFVPHVVAAAILAYLTRSGGRCDTYYSHPNGSVGQMVVEVTAWAILGISALMHWSGGSWSSFVAVVLAWWLAYVAAFYAWLGAFSHWTWAHTIAISTTLLLLSAACRPTRG